MGLEWPVAAKSLTLEVIIHLIEFGKIKAVAMLSTTGRAGKEAVTCVLSPDRIAAIKMWREVIWSAQLPVLQRAVEAAVCGLPPLALAVRVSLLDAFGEVANRRNLCPWRVRAICFTRASEAEGEAREVPRRAMVRFDFRCPRRHGLLQPVRDIPVAYRLRSGTDDLMLLCSHCGRDQIEEDQMILHCPRFGCCYDLCLRCAEVLGLGKACAVGCLSIFFVLGGAGDTPPDRQRCCK
ncbi:unnamed protein product [Symbiodinium natans]|uniref:Uncharacterized protein n=1 Tax=Symbiodinium natans TaxID=878477 RepID=A0A812S4M2_9DINO|nr:unnamed protein product [Symbiodinium natans]